MHQRDNGIVAQGTVSPGADLVAVMSSQGLHLSNTATWQPPCSALVAAEPVHLGYGGGAVLSRFFVAISSLYRLNLPYLYLACPTAWSGAVYMYNAPMRPPWRHSHSGLSDALSQCLFGCRRVQTCHLRRFGVHAEPFCHKMWHNSCGDCLQSWRKCTALGSPLNLPSHLKMTSLSMARKVVWRRMHVDHQQSACPACLQLSPSPTTSGMLLASAETHEPAPLP
jgi:hypothetical protein